MESTASTFDSSSRKSDKVRTGHFPAAFERESRPNVPTNLRRAHTVTQGANIVKTNINSRATRDRAATSLLRAKDSHEMLRQRSYRSLDTPQALRDARAGVRGPSHFTVGNVGQNGKIFLRPIRNPPHKEPQPPSFSPSTNHTRGDRLHPQGHGRVGDDTSRWSNSQLSELRPEFIPEESYEDGDSVYTESAPSEYDRHHRRRQRAYSFSTISEQRSVSGAMRHGEPRSFIDRSDDRPRSADGSFRPTLEIPIPHYRLGIPQFNAEGSVALHSSIYSRNSMLDNLRVSRFLRESFNASPMPKVYIDGPSQPDRPSFAVSMFSGRGATELAQSSTDTGNPVFYELKEPIGPSMFDYLASEMDDESVVRYIPGTKDIGAATPARVVAQISSESFMDYELVSDFFLTFRSYLSTANLLDLLLARLQWAINRLQDDGRIIRIRTFAALRHWILNYFGDDFVPSYRLRAHFCETINTMYNNVKARQGGGMSDLKILIDLKRCWYGKCSAYWDFPELHIAYNGLDCLILPGGPGEETNTSVDNPEHHHPSVVQTESGQQIKITESEGKPIVQHSRNDSSATTQSMPKSAQSEQSVLVTSCSLPPKSPKRLSIPLPGSRGPHPVPVLPTKLPYSLQDPQSPSSIISKRLPFQNHAHKRSGSFSDSARDDRAPLPLLKLDQQGFASSQEILNLGSLIRGELYSPVESYMTMMAPPSPPLPSSANTPTLDRRNTSDETSKTASPSSGVKTIIGSIRRALHSRHAGQSISSRTVNGPVATSMRGKTSALPNNVAFGSELYRDKKSAATSKKTPRIDILCDESLQQYHRLVTGHVESNDDSPRTAKQRPGLDTEKANYHALVPDYTKARSQETMGSESIVIVDGTGLETPIMSGAVPAPAITLEESPDFLNFESSPTTPKVPGLRVPSHRSDFTADQYSLPIYYDDTDPNRSSRSPRSSGFSASRRSLSVERFSASWKRPSSSLHLRKYASFQSGISRQRSTAVNEPVPSTADSNISQDNSERQGGPTLRRRPGGNLRQMRDGGGLHPDSGSFASYASYRSSYAGSVITRPEDDVSRPQTSLVPSKPRFSLIQTHSSQNMRRSFEAAIAQFAQIPDDDDGGIESALLKLEGKWTSPSPSDDRNATGTAELLPNAHSGGSGGEPEWLNHEYVAGQHDPTSSDTAGRSQKSSFGDNLRRSQAHGHPVPSQLYSDSVAESEESYNSIPLLERGLSDESMRKPTLSRVISHPAVPPISQLSGRSKTDASDVVSSHASFDVVKKTESLMAIPRGSTLPVMSRRSRTTTNRLSGLSSELSVIDPQEAMEHRLSLDTRSLGDSSLGIPPHPLAHPPSPPMTIQQPRSVASCASPLNPVLFQAQPLTPDPSPRHGNEGRGISRRSIVRQISGDVLSRSETDRQRQDSQNGSEPDHIPFVLSCESQVLAQQLTLVEMAALSEVDWRDLVDMRWSSGLLSTRNWVQFLTEKGRRGIDLVVGRFNLMVKWVLSEIVLTKDIHERASTITKFIHTAAHARRICNYATMLQIAIALSSTDCSRLQSTWALVSSGDRRLLKDMELLIQPVRNFHDLRVEMETANLQEGCIPFVGLYVHDLTYNAQKPGQVANSDGEPLINFERYRTAAKIVKNLLRLIDASTKYNFEPVQGIIERCLWIASLSEQQIQTRSRMLE